LRGIYFEYRTEPRDNNCLNLGFRLFALILVHLQILSAQQSHEDAEWTRQKSKRTNLNEESEKESEKIKKTKEKGGKPSQFYLHSN
jgi:hypothetical protein